MSLSQFNKAFTLDLSKAGLTEIPPASFDKGGEFPPLLKEG